MLDEPTSVPSTGIKPASDRARRGPETVLNPEGRPAGLQPAAPGGHAPTALSAGLPAPLPQGVSTATAGPRSSIVRVLFPAEGDAAVIPFDPGLGLRLAHFSLVERIRSGGMGSVFRAIDNRLGREVALKILSPGLSRDGAVVERFRREAVLAAQLDHPHIARAYFVGEDQGLWFIAFEYIPGVNVRDLISTRGALEVVDVLNFATQIARALVHMASRGIVHRDIKPSNIIVTPAGQAKLVDMGLARSQTRDDAAADLTTAGTTLGTFDYISPEQARDPRSADARSDIYSLGCTLYHMLTAQPPYPDGTVLQKLLQHQGEEAPDPAEKNPEIPQALSAVVCRMMAKDPRRRYQSPDHLVRDLNLAAQSLGLRAEGSEGLVWRAPPPGPSFWQRNMAWISTVGLLLGIAAWLEFGRPAATPRENPRRLTGLPPAQDPPETPRGDTVRSAPSAAGEGGTKGAIVSARPAAGLRAGARELAEVVALALPDRVVGDLSRRDGTRDDAVSGGIVPIELAADGAGLAESRGATEGPGGNVADSGVKRPGGLADNGSVDEEAGSPGAMVAEEEGFVLLGRDGGADRRFSSLEAACAAVRNDGAVIELRFHGRRRETGLRITRRITIRADKRFTPVVEFAPIAGPDSEPVRAIVISGGELNVVGGSFALQVDDVVRADSWSLFALDRPDALRLQGTTLTVVNPRGRNAACIEWHGGDADMMPDMPIPGAQARPPLIVELAECLIRGESDLFLIRRVEPVRLEIRQTAVALRGALLHDRVAVDSRSENSLLELRLDHVTAVLGDALVRVDCAAEVRKPPQIQVTASNCIFSSANESPLVAMSGSLPVQDFRSPFVWAGRYNFYDRVATFWSVVSREGTGRAEAWDFAAWRKHWPESSEANPRLDMVVWAHRQLMSQPTAELVATDFALERRGINPAVGGAGDSTDAGANLSLLPRGQGPLAGEATARERNRN